MDGHSLSGLSGAQAAGDEAVGAGLELGSAALGEQVGRGAARPVVRGAGPTGRPGVGEEELPPLVDQVEAGREGRLVAVVVARRGAGRPARRRTLSHSSYDAAQRVEVPARRSATGSNPSAPRGPGAWRRRVRGSSRARPRGERADPDVVGRARRTRRRPGRRGAGPRGRARRAGRRRRGASGRPTSGRSPAGRRGRRPRRGGGWRARSSR